MPRLMLGLTAHADARGHLSSAHIARSTVDQAHEIELMRDIGASRIARDWLADLLAAELEAEKLTTVRLLASELVTNAVVHGEGAITVRAQLHSSGLVVEVIDEGHGFHWALPNPDRDQTRGWGLSVVAAESDRWGTVPGKSRVWFELDS